MRQLRHLLPNDTPGGYAPGRLLGWVLVLAACLGGHPAQARPGQVQLYPNPARRTATVEVPASLGRLPVTATLLDATGRLVRTFALPAQGAAAHVLDLLDLPAGLYNLRLATSAGTITRPLALEP